MWDWLRQESEALTDWFDDNRRARNAAEQAAHGLWGLSITCTASIFAGPLNAIEAALLVLVAIWPREIIDQWPIERPKDTALDLAWFMGGGMAGAAFAPADVTWVSPAGIVAMAMLLSVLGAAKDSAELDLVNMLLSRPCWRCGAHVPTESETTQPTPTVAAPGQAHRITDPDCACPLCVASRPGFEEGRRRGFYS